ncbi:hypothetical protein MUB16_26080 [Priestia sp. OVL9]|nr:hypothetical protein [Priestia sp. OVL9]
MLGIENDTTLLMLLGASTMPSTILAIDTSKMLIRAAPLIFRAVNTVTAIKPNKASNGPVL